jgi:hypothetical protein
MRLHTPGAWFGVSVHCQALSNRRCQHMSPRKSPWGAQRTILPSGHLRICAALNSSQNRDLSTKYDCGSGRVENLGQKQLQNYFPAC